MPIILEFVEAILEYLYVAPEKMLRFKQGLIKYIKSKRVSVSGRERRVPVFSLGSGTVNGQRTTKYHADEGTRTPNL